MENSGRNREEVLCKSTSSGAQKHKETDFKNDYVVFEWVSFLSWTHFFFQAKNTLGEEEKGRQKEETKKEIKMKKKDVMKKKDAMKRKGAKV